MSHALHMGDNHDQDLNCSESEHNLIVISRRSIGSDQYFSKNHRIIATSKELSENVFSDEEEYYSKEACSLNKQRSVMQLEQ